MELLKEYKYYIENFFRQIGLDWLADNFYLIFLLFAIILFPLITWVYKWHLKFKQSKILLRSKTDIQPYVPAWLIEKLLKEFIHTKIQKTPPSKYAEIRDSIIQRKIERIPAIKHFTYKIIENDALRHKFFLILGDSGMGKTTFLINLFHYYNSKPRTKYRIKYLPFGIPNIENEIKQIPDADKINTVIILDGLDEDPKARSNYKNRLDNLIDLCWKFRYVIISCRTQFFPSSFEEPNKTHIQYNADEKGYHEIKKYFMSPFNDNDIRKYLSKKFGFWNWTKILKSKRVVNKSPNLMVRPMLLDNINDLIDAKKEVKYAHQIYNVLIDKWIERESKRFVDEGDKSLFKINLYKFSQNFALYLFNKNEYSIDIQEISNLEKDFDVSLDQFEMKNRSLLNRDTIGSYKFSHKSILEYFIAIHAFSNTDFQETSDFTGYTYVQLFLDELKWGNYPSLAYIVKGDITVFIKGNGKTIATTYYNTKDRETIKNANAILVYDYNSIDDISLLLQLKKEIAYSPSFIIFFVPLNITTVMLRFIQRVSKKHNCTFLIENKLIGIYRYLSRKNELPSTPFILVSVNSTNIDYAIIFNGEIIHHYYSSTGSKGMIEMIKKYILQYRGKNINDYGIGVLLEKMHNDRYNTQTETLENLGIGLFESVTFQNIDLGIFETNVILNNLICKEVFSSITQLLMRSNPEFSKDIYSTGIFFTGDIFRYSVFKPIFYSLHYMTKLPIKYADFHTKNAEIYNDIFDDYIHLSRKELESVKEKAYQAINESFLKKQEINPLEQRLGSFRDE